MNRPGPDAERDPFEAICAREARHKALLAGLEEAFEADARPHLPPAQHLNATQIRILGGMTENMQMGQLSRVVAMRNPYEPVQRLCDIGLLIQTAHAGDKRRATLNRTERGRTLAPIARRVLIRLLAEQKPEKAGG